MPKPKPETVLVRIKPSVKRDTHVVANHVIRKGKWYEIPASLEDAFRAEPVHDANPDGPMVFDVKSPAEAAELARSEERRQQDATTGTPERPVKPETVGGPAQPAVGGRRAQRRP